MEMLVVPFYTISSVTFILKSYRVKFFHLFWLSWLISTGTFKINNFTWRKVWRIAALDVNFYFYCNHFQERCSSLCCWWPSQSQRSWNHSSLSWLLKCSMLPWWNEGMGSGWRTHKVSQICLLHGNISLFESGEWHK